MRGLQRGKGVQEKAGPGRGKKKTTPHDGARFSKTQPESTSELRQARIDAGISRKQAEKWQELAAVPQEKFEEALSDPVRQVKPSADESAFSGLGLQSACRYHTGDARVKRLALKRC